jgi:hypothetical protein
MVQIQLTYSISGLVVTTGFGNSTDECPISGDLS